MRENSFAIRKSTDFLTTHTRAVSGSRPPDPLKNKQKNILSYDKMFFVTGTPSRARTADTLIKSRSKANDNEAKKYAKSLKNQSAHEMRTDMETTLKNTKTTG